MKKILAATLLLSQLYAMPAGAGVAEYNQGFKEGFKVGYCDARSLPKTYCTAPYPPYPSYPAFGRDTYELGFADGYQKGHARGK